MFDTSPQRPHAIAVFHQPTIAVQALLARHLAKATVPWNRWWDANKVQSRQSLVAHCIGVPFACGEGASQGDNAGVFIIHSFCSFYKALKSQIRRSQRATLFHRGFQSPQNKSVGVLPNRRFQPPFKSSSSPSPPSRCKPTKSGRWRCCRPTRQSTLQRW